MHGGKHTKVYDAFFDLDGTRRARKCEITGQPYADICHIEPSGMGGRESTHVIKNLIALHPKLHTFTEGRFKDWLRENHEAYIETGLTLYERKGLDDPIFRQFIHQNYRDGRF